MYRAVVLTTLVLLLIAVAGVSVAQEGRIFGGEPNSDEPPGSTTPERTSFGATGPEDTTTSPPPGASSEAEDHQNIPESTVVTEPTDITEPTAGEPEKSTAAPAREETPTPATNEVGNPGDSGRAVGKPAPAGESPDVVKPPVEAGQHGNGVPVERGNEVEPERGVGGQKATLCHKGKTLTVGAGAQAAHLRHGDSLGACP